MSRPSSFRGRGARGSSRGRGRGQSRGPRQTSFSAGRIKEEAEEDLSRPSTDNEASEVDDVGIEGSISDVTSDEEAETPLARPYNTLLQSLKGSEPGPKRKKRKLDANVEKTEPKDAIARGSLRTNTTETGLDLIDENEEDPITEIKEAELDQETEEDDEISSDPFNSHFANPEETKLSDHIKSVSLDQWASSKHECGKAGNLIFSIPKSDARKTQSHPLQIIKDPGALKLKARLVESTKKLQPQFDELESRLAPVIFNYEDLLYTGCNTANAEGLRKLFCLHALSHVFKTRDRVIKNNAKLAREGGDELELRDQGFTRPKVLIILPTRHACAKVIEIITQLCDPEQQENRKRFVDGFLDDEEKFSNDKPEDFRDLFGGNDDDMFRLGMKFTRKTIKYFAQFYNSDIIFASPLGLWMTFGSGDEKKADYDFLSSLELVILDQADALLMQNWEHVSHIFNHLNHQPKEARGCDFSRVRNWYLDGNARYLRQTIVLSAFNTPELNRLFLKDMQNVAGKAKLSPEYDGAVLYTGIQLKQTFSRFESEIPSNDPNMRFKYFTTAIIPSLARNSKSSTVLGILIFIPSYLDFVRVRNYFSTSAATQNISFGTISEYSGVKEVARARSHFYNGKHSVLLYTERAHHFRRYRLRGVKRVMMYGLPDNPIFYQEIVGGFLGQSLQDGKADTSETSVRSLFSKWDSLKLERIVGTGRIAPLLREKGGDTFDFV